MSLSVQQSLLQTNRSAGVRSVLKEKEEEEQLLRELCCSNGISYNKLLQHVGHDVTKLEMFFSGFHRILGLRHFPNLTYLCLMNQAIGKIEGLSCCPVITELWLCECEIKTLEGLDQLLKLKRLYLYSNKIDQIKNINLLLDLEVLWLNDNQIARIEGVDGLHKLHELNLAENKISRVDHSLDNHPSLENIDLSGNLIYSFSDLTNLSRLPKLKYLSMKNPQYSANPVCNLCNYTTHVLYHLPTLKRLDTKDVSAKMLQDLAEATVMKKKMYYNMRVKTIKRNMADLISRLDVEKKRVVQDPVDRIKALCNAIKDLEREIEENYPDSEIEQINKDKIENNSVGMFVDKIEALKARVAKWKRKIKQVDGYYTDCLNRIKNVADMSLKRLTVELETGGNVRFEDGKPQDVWYSSCHDLIMSRFCATDYKDVEIVGIKVHRITRVHNRILRSRFDDRLEQLMESGLPGLVLKGAQYKKLLEYLFYVSDPTLPGGICEQINILEHGFPDSATFTKLGKNGAVPLTNSVNLCDRPRIDEMLKDTKGRPPIDCCPFKHGQIIVCKVFLGRTVSALDIKRLDRSFYPQTDSVFKPKKKEVIKNVPLPAVNTATQGQGCTGRPNDLVITDDVNIAENIIDVNGIVKKSLEDDQPSKPFCGISQSGYLCTLADSGKDSQSCDCALRQCEWFVFDNEMVVPEYIVDFEYMTKWKMRSPFSMLAESVNNQKSNTTHLTTTQQQQIESSSALSDPNIDDDLLQDMSPLIKQRPRLVSLNEELLLKSAQVTSLSSVTVLNLHGNGISRLKNLPIMPNLIKLVLSFNDLTRLDDIGKMQSLEYLDISFNKLNTLEGMKSLVKLKYLDLSWNELCNTRDDVAILRKHAPSVVTLDVTHNPWHKPDGLRLRVIGRLKSLRRLNNQPVTENEAAAALRVAAGARISQLSLLTNSRTNHNRPRSLSLCSVAEVLTATSRHRPDRTADADTEWFSKVTSLNMNCTHLSKISNLERLDNLRWASFNDNDITKIEGLESCCNLEELSLENNCITKIEGLSKLVKLRRLNLASNLITSLEGSGLEKLTNLHYLSLENNRITSLSPLHKVPSLIELYIGNNNIINTREIFNLKNLPNFVILDLCGNPVSCDTEYYRLYVIFHIRNLKALDGLAISQTESSQARDTFGGKMTLDFIAEKIGHSRYEDIRQLDFPNCAIRVVELGVCDVFNNLRSVNLEHNSLSSFSGLTQLNNLKVLCLNYNHIECVINKQYYTTNNNNNNGSNNNNNRNNTRTYSTQQANNLSVEVFSPVMHQLEVLHLGYNGITNLKSLQLGHLPSLKSLFLQGNDISEIDGLVALRDLRELVLDRNKIKSIGEYSFIAQCNLVELHLEENRLKELNNFVCLESLQRLYLGQNRIQDMVEMEKLECLPNLIELSVINNAVSRRLMHRPVLVFRQPNLLVIDGIPVTDEERHRAELYFIDQQPVTNPVESALPGIQQYKTQTPIKVTSVQLGPAPGNHWGSSNIQEDFGVSRRARIRAQIDHSLPNNMAQQFINMATSQQQQQQQPQHNSTFLPVSGARSQYRLTHQIPYIPHHTQGSNPGESSYITDTLSRLPGTRKYRNY